MSWKSYHVVLRLCSPMHIGKMKLGNVQRTRPYVTGRVLWGALTARLTRDDASGPATDSALYQAMGKTIDETLAFTYFYPTIHKDGVMDKLWPWDDGFGSRFLSTYASTALTYPQQSADEGTLHEVECVVPHSKDGPVYLSGYVFAQDGAPDWQSALDRLQLGGERGYGWGRVELLRKSGTLDNNSLFGKEYTVEENTWPPVLKAGKDAPLLAHALAADFDEKGEKHQAVGGVEGKIEPLVGREVDPADGRFGVQISEARICYAPGAQVTQETRFAIGPYGVWQRPR